MSDNEVANMIFRSWKSELKDKDRSMKSVRPNFDELAHSLYAADVSPETARNFIKPAFKAHMFTEEQARRKYKTMTRKWKPYNEWRDSWAEAIEDAANAAFMVYFSPVNKNIQKIEQVVISSPSEDIEDIDDDTLNEDQFYRRTKKVTKDNPWLFGQEEI